MRRLLNALNALLSPPTRPPAVCRVVGGELTHHAPPIDLTVDESIRWYLAAP